MTVISTLLQTARQHHQAGQLDQAREYYFQILGEHSDHLETLHGLGVLYAQLRQYQQATYYLQRAIQLNDQIADFHYNLGNVLLFQHAFERAKACYQRALQLDSYPEAHVMLGNIFYEQKNFNQARIHYQTAQALNPQLTEPYIKLSHLCYEQGGWSEAIQFAQQALHLHGENAQAYASLGHVCNAQKKFQQAEMYYRQALALAPQDGLTHYNLGLSLFEQSRLTEAIACYHTALTLEPHFAQAHYNLALALRAQGKLDEALQQHRFAIEKEPTTILFYSGWLFTLNCTDQSAQNIFLEHQHFDEQLALPLASKILPHYHDYHPHRRLKIGYLSSDFRKHSVAYFIAPILAHHHAHQFEIFCYYDYPTDDEMTSQLQSYVHHWVPCYQVSDEALAEKIRQDQIDILVDLIGHTSRPRLLTLARKPAPIQITYLGYPYTTGLTAIDYKITDRYIDVDHLNHHLNSETPLKMPASLYCYQPYEETPPVNDLPVLKTGILTFSSFNHYTKLNPFLLRLWADILHQIPHSRLLLKTNSFKDEATRKRFEETLLEWGIGPHRWFWEEVTPPPLYLKSYHQVDIALDSYPFNGGTTTCEALWMGVPVITLVGERQVSRLGCSILSTLGLTEWITLTPQDYVKHCVHLAQQYTHLQTLRKEMRTRMQNSPLMQAEGFTKDLEMAYHHLWKKLCEEQELLFNTG